MPDVLTAQLVGQTQVHPSAISQFSNATQMAASEEQLDGLIIDYFKLLQTQVENLDFKAAENMTGILDAVLCLIMVVCTIWVGLTNTVLLQK